MAERIRLFNAKTSAEMEYSHTRGAKANNPAAIDDAHNANLFMFKIVKNSFALMAMKPAERAPKIQHIVFTFHATVGDTSNSMDVAPFNTLGPVYSLSMKCDNNKNVGYPGG